MGTVALAMGWSMLNLGGWKLFPSTSRCAKSIIELRFFTSHFYISFSIPQTDLSTTFSVQFCLWGVRSHAFSPRGWYATNASSTRRESRSTWVAAWLFFWELLRICSLNLHLVLVGLVGGSTQLMFIWSYPHATFIHLSHRCAFHIIHFFLLLVHYLVLMILLPNQGSSNLLQSMYLALLKSTRLPRIRVFPTLMATDSPSFYFYFYEPRSYDSNTMIRYGEFPRSLRHFLKLACTLLRQLPSCRKSGTY